MEAPILTRTLDMIAFERGHDCFEQSFELVQQLVAVYGEDDLAERLYSDIPPECPWEVVADLFGFLVWLTSDNGWHLIRTMENWLRAGDDTRRIRVALNSDVFPFADSAEMELVLERIAGRLPEVAEDCRRAIEARHQIRETKLVK